jgi:hypothetical protein
LGFRSVKIRNDIARKNVVVTLTPTPMLTLSSRRMRARHGLGIKSRQKCDRLTRSILPAYCSDGVASTLILS